MDAVETETIGRNKEKTSAVFCLPLAVNSNMNMDTTRRTKRRRRRRVKTKAIDEETIGRRNPLLLLPAALLLPGWSKTG